MDRWSGREGDDADGDMGIVRKGGGALRGGVARQGLQGFVSSSASATAPVASSATVVPSRRVRRPLRSWTKNGAERPDLYGHKRTGKGMQEDLFLRTPTFISSPSCHVPKWPSLLHSLHPPSQKAVIFTGSGKAPWKFQGPSLGSLCLPKR